jgi:multidrug transporter EmrE-like cation transporter
MTGKVACRFFQRIPGRFSTMQWASGTLVGGRVRRRLTDFAEGGDEMSAVKIMAIVLIVAGIVGLLYGSFSYTKETHDIKLGQIEISVAEKQTVNVPVWAGVGAIVVGTVLLLYASKKTYLREENHDEKNRNYSRRRDSLGHCTLRMVGLQSS